MDIDLIRFLTVFGNVSPSIWDIIPRGPLVPVGRASKAAQVELNPQPIPPGREILFASGQVAHEIAMAAVAAEAAGGEGVSRIVGRAVDDWCGTPPRHIPIPWPGPWPGPWVLDHEGLDVKAIVPASRLIGALTFASVASRMAEGEARDALASGAEKLLETALA
jgi:hypothetical protein